MSEENAKVPVDQYNAVVESAHIVDVKLIESNFEIRPSFFAEDVENLRFLYGCEAGAGHFDGESRRLVGTFHLEAGAKKARKFLLKARAVYVVAFEIEGDPVEAAALAYLSRVGSFACWPYFRAHVAGLCGSAGAEVPPLPIMRGNLPKRI